MEYYERGGGAYVNVAVQVIPVAPPPPPDTAAPDSTITTPANKATVPAGSVTATGTSTDDKGVTEVRIGVRNRDTTLWLQGDGTWASAYAYRLATVASPGATSTGWSIDVNLPAPGTTGSTPGPATPRATSTAAPPGGRSACCSRRRPLPRALGGGPSGYLTVVQPRTVGIEEELFLIDPATRQVAPRSQAVLSRVVPDPSLEPDEDLDKELFRHQLETRTTPLSDLGELRTHLVRQRRAAAEAAADGRGAHCCDRHQSGRRAASP